MQFTQIQEISSFLNTSYHTNTLENDVFRNDNWTQKLASQQIFDEPFFHQVMKNIQYLNQDQHKSIPPSILINENSSIQLKQIQSTQDKDTHDKDTIDPAVNDQIYRKFDKTKSVIFKSTLSTSRLLTDSKIDSGFIKIFFFNSPVMKMIPYNHKCTIKDLIRKSIDTYILENNDMVRINQSLEKFQMRLPVHQNDFSPDMAMQPIHPERLLSQNLFDTLVLVQKSKKQDSYVSKPTKQYSFDDSSMSFSSSLRSDHGNTQTVKFTIMDQTYFELMTIDLQKEGNLQTLFKMIRQNGLHNYKEFVIREDPESQYQLSPDYEVKLIEKNRLYLMSKKYMDDADDDMFLGPIRLKSLIPQEINYQIPIGINEASRYEQFQVTKINSFGIAIQRILGIDQTKVYNYDKQLRQNKRQISLVDKFLGLNNQTGTKKPYRLIRDIKEIQKFHGGVEIIFPDKITTYIIKNQTMRDQILRKLNFLIDWHKKNTSEIKEDHFKSNREDSSKANKQQASKLKKQETSKFNSSKKSHSFFKF